MATVTYVLHKGQPLTEEQKAELEYLRNMRDDDIVYDEDCPKQTEEELRQFKRMNPFLQKAVG